jgi:hypothetical protein
VGPGRTIIANSDKVVGQAVRLRELLDEAGLTAVNVKVDSHGDLIIPEGGLKFAEAAGSVAEADPGNTQQVAGTQLTISKLYYERALWEGRQSFLSALVAAAVGLVLFATAIGFSFATNRVNAALISALGGAIVEVIAGLNFWLYAKVAKQLDAFHVRLERTQRFLLANSVAQNLIEPDKTKALSQLVVTISTSPIEKQGDRLSAVEPAVNEHVSSTEQQ